MGNCGSSAASDAVHEASHVKPTRTGPTDKGPKSPKQPKKKKVDPQALAAVTLQKHARARTGRARGAAYMAEKAEIACTCYRVNVKSETFGVCFCGWPKAEHSDEALHKGATNVAGPKRVGSNEVSGQAESKRGGGGGRCAAIPPLRARPRGRLIREMPLGPALLKLWALEALPSPHPLGSHPPKPPSAMRSSALACRRRIR